MPSLARRATGLALDLLFPPQCGVCRRGGPMICADCAAMLPPADGSRCDRCWMPIRSAPRCRHCVDSPPAFASIRSAFVMDTGARALVHRLKYDGMTALAAPMAALLAGAIDAEDADLVVPVPLHRGRQRSRGYNQSAHIGRHLASAVGFEFDARAARRTRATMPLVKAMSREERREIVAGAFAGDEGRLGGRRILLVDDVVTTGATLDSCAGALMAAGAAEVRCVTFARAD